jgi:hypothetical protein
MLEGFTQQDCWKFSPGEQAKFWGSMLNKNIASIGWFNCDYTHKSINEIAQTNPELGRGSVRIIHLFNQIKLGDIVLAFKGRQTILGYGIVKSLAKYTITELHPNSIHHNYIDVEWHILPNPFRTESYFSIDTVSKVTDRYDEFSTIFSGDFSSGKTIKQETAQSNKPQFDLFADIGSKLSTIQGNHASLKNILDVEMQANQNQGYKIFISYRRDDEAKYLVPTLAEKLNTRYGECTAFYDVDNIPLGVDFRDHLKSAIEKSSIVLVVIGEKWLGNSTNNVRRIDMPSDFVRIEVESALDMNKIVIPVLTGNVTMPQETDLPHSISSLAYRNAARLSSGTDYSSHFSKLLEALDPLLSYSS